MFGLIADGVNGRREEACEAGVVDERRGQHEAALRPAHPEQPPPDERLLRWKVQLPLLHGREHARSIKRGQHTLPPCLPVYPVDAPRLTCCDSVPNRLTTACRLGCADSTVPARVGGFS